MLFAHKANFNLIKCCLILTACIICSSCKNLDIQKISDTLQNNPSLLSEQTVVNGLKEALEIGTKNSVAKTAQVGGFYNNALIKIGIPDQLQSAAKTLKDFGLGSYVQQLESQMNRAAEVASAEAKLIFINSITRMSVNDAWGILKGSDNAATEYFRKDTEVQLKQKFQPIINRSMNQVGFYQDYQDLLKAYSAIPLTKKPLFNIEDYVMQKSLDGIFTLVAEEEAKIRHDPQARVTDLLKRVFQ